MSTQGMCLCGKVQFEILGPLPNLYRCHCSLCRKVTGASSNTATLVPAETFRWLSGKERISSYRLDSGYRSDFCSCCGSPVPNEIKAQGDVWIPAGLLANVEGSPVVLDIHTSSAACWYKPTQDSLSLDKGPESYQAFKDLLND